MKNLTKITLASVATLALIGCGDSYNDNNNPTTQPTVVTEAQLKASNRNAKYLTDTDGMSLYTFDNDTLNKSNCLVGACQDTWPLFVGVDNNDSDIKAVPESEGHLAYRKHPLYYFANDIEVGDVNGNNINEVWHLVHAQTAPADTQVKLSETNIKQTFLTNKDQRALYTFDKDEKGVSNCYDSTPTSGEGCESTWPVFYRADLGTLPTGTSEADFGVIDRNTTRAKEGEPTQQVTYKGSPLYYFTPDNKEALSTKGDWVQGVWHLAEISSEGIPAVPEPKTEKITFDNVGASDYKITSTSNENVAALNGLDSTLTLTVGNTYEFTTVNFRAHPLQLKDKNGKVLLAIGSSGSLESNADIKFSDDDSGKMTFTLTQELADVLASYGCEFHATMLGSISIK